MVNGIDISALLDIIRLISEASAKGIKLVW